MKILYVCKSLPHSFQGGIQTHVWKLSGRMVGRGHQISILTAGSFKQGVRHLSMEGRDIIELPYLPGRHLPIWATSAEEIFFNLAARAWLLKNQSDFDIIHLQGRSGNLFLKNKNLVKVPVVNTLHGLIEIEQTRALGQGRARSDSYLHRRLAGNMENHALLNADSLIAVSEEMMDELAARMPQALAKATRIYNGVDVPALLPPEDTDPNLLLFVGRLTALKGVFELVEAMQLLPPYIRLAMIGDGDARPELVKRIRQLGLENRIELLGGLPAAQVEPWLGRCHALVLPSFHETQGIVLMEANAFGKPVVANAVGGVAEVVQNGKNGLLTESNSPENIAFAVSYLFQHRERAALMGQFGRQWVQERFSWASIAEQTEVVYQMLANGHFQSLAAQEGVPEMLTN